MMHETESGAWAGNRSEGGAIHDERNFSINLNKPLPWFGVLALVTIFMAWQAGQAKQIAFDAQTTALLAEQHFKDYTKTTDEYIEKLRFELASHGIKPPEKSK